MPFVAMLESVLTIMTAAGVAAVTIAICWMGYKLLFFGDHHAREGVPMLLIGAVMVLGARGLATLLSLFN